MSTISVPFTNDEDLPEDQTSVVFGEPSGTLGVQRLDTGENVVPPLTVLDHAGTGIYSYTFTDPAPNLIYAYWIQYVDPGGVTKYKAGILDTASQSTVDILSYTTPKDADTYFKTRLNSDDWLAISDVEQKQKALNDAARIIDRFAYIGWKANRHQHHAWPRIGIWCARSDEIPQAIKEAEYEIAYSLLVDGIDVTKELNKRRVLSRKFGTVATTYDPKETSDYILWGIPSWLAWTLLLPYIDLNRSESIRLDRMT